MESRTRRAQRAAAVALLALCLPWSAQGALHTKAFAGTLSCFVNCAPPSAQTAFLQGTAFNGTYTYDDAVVPSSGDPSTFRDYGSVIDIALDIGGGVYTLTVTGGSLEIARNHYGAGRLDDVFLYGMPSVFAGSGMATFPAVVPAGPFESYVKFANTTAPNVLPDTLIASWPQTVAAWSTGFAGVEFYIQDGGSNVVGFHGPFTTLTDASVPTLATNATPSVVIGATIGDTATLTGGSSPTGTVTFNAFGPNDPTCASAPAFTVAVPLASGSATASVSPTAVGTYRWIASYGGDGANSAVAGACNDAGEASTVTVATPTLGSTGTPHGSATLGAALADAATLAGGFNPTGSIVFRLYGPTDPTCSGSPAFTSAPIPVNGNGAYASGSFSPAVVGTYSWIATYGGDPNNAPATGACGQALATVALAAPDVIVVPALDPAGLALLGVGLGAAALLAMRRRRRTR